jgi:hypothetical protein
MIAAGESIDFRWGSTVDHLPAYATEFVRMSLAVILRNPRPVVEPTLQSNNFA